MVTKYQAASEMTNRALAKAVALVKPGASVLAVCKEVDDFIASTCASSFNKQKQADGRPLDKGPAFPCCISVNSVAAHFSPVEGCEQVIREGDVCGIDLGCHIDGWITVGAHTVVAQADPAAPVTGKAADVIAAANTVMELALRTIKAGADTGSAGDLFQEVAEAYGCNMCEGVLSHNMKRFQIDGNKVVLDRTTHDQKVEINEIEQAEVYAIDIVVSTGEGKLKVQDEKETSVYKTDKSVVYNLKMKASRAFFSEVMAKFPDTPFTIRALEDQRAAKLGVKECLDHGLLMDYPVLHESKDEIVAHFKSTVLLMPSGNQRITSHPLQELQTDKKVTDEKILALLAQPLKKKKKKKKAKAASEE